jgi:hypothetical protein
MTPSPPSEGRSVSEDKNRTDDDSRYFHMRPEVAPVRDKHKTERVEQYLMLDQGISQMQLSRICKKGEWRYESDEAVDRILSCLFFCLFFVILFFDI